MFQLSPRVLGSTCPELKPTRQTIRCMATIKGVGGCLELETRAAAAGKKKTEVLARELLIDYQPKEQVTDMARHFALIQNFPIH